METVAMTDITRMRKVVGYQLPSRYGRPIEYEIEISTAGDKVYIMNRYTVRGILCSGYEKRVTFIDTFVSNDDRLILESTSSFCGFVERGKTFRILEIGRYMVLVGAKQIFIYSEDLRPVSTRDRHEIVQKIERCEEAPEKIDIVFLDQL